MFKFGIHSLPYLRDVIYRWPRSLKKKISILKFHWKWFLLLTTPTPTTLSFLGRRKITSLSLRQKKKEVSGSKIIPPFWKNLGCLSVICQKQEGFGLNCKTHLRYFLARFWHFILSLIIVVYRRVIKSKFLEV